MSIRSMLAVVAVVALGGGVDAIMNGDKVKVFKTNANCNIKSRGNVNTAKHAWEGVQHLQSKDEWWHLEAGPSTCSRLSCSYKTAINWCNDSKFPITVHSSDVTGYAFDILNTCNDGESSNFNGQSFNSSEAWNWNVILEAADC